MYLPAEGQENNFMPFFSVTNHGTFPEYFPEMPRETISFLNKRRDNANTKTIKITCSCNFYSTDPCCGSILWYVWLYVLLVFVQTFEIKLVYAASLNAKWRNQNLGGSSPVLFNSVNRAVMSLSPCNVS